jgi:SAM-dependent methyltransferase
MNQNLKTAGDLSAWACRLTLPNGDHQPMAFSATKRSPQLRIDENGLAFDFSEGDQLYVTAGGHRDFARPPATEAAAIHLTSDTWHTIRGTLTGDAASCSLWLIEYDADGRLQHRTTPLATGPIEFRWRTHLRHHSLFLAIRIAGAGQFRIDELSITVDASAIDGRLGKLNSNGLRIGQRGGYQMASLLAAPPSCALAKPRRLSSTQVASDEVSQFLSTLPANTQTVVFCADDVLAPEVSNNPPVISESTSNSSYVALRPGPHPSLPSESFDVAMILTGSTPLSVTEQQQTFRECRRLLKSKGTLWVGHQPASELLAESGASAADNSQTLALIEAAGFKILSTEKPHKQWPIAAQPSDLTASNDNRVVRPGTYALTGESQLTLRVRPSQAVQLSIQSESSTPLFELKIEGTGACHINDSMKLAASDSARGVYACLQVLRPDLSQPEVLLQVWVDGELAVTEQLALAASASKLSITIPTAAAAPEHVDLWTLPIIASHEISDAAIAMAHCRPSCAEFPDITHQDMAKEMQLAGIDRALVMAYHSDRDLDGFDEIQRLAQLAPAQVFPLFRFTTPPEAEADFISFLVDQLEVLWQQGMLTGLAIDIAAGEAPADSVLDWLESRQAITLWHVRDVTDLDWIERNALEPNSFPVLLRIDGGSSNQLLVAKVAVLCRKYPQARIVADPAIVANHHSQLIEMEPSQVLLTAGIPKHPLDSMRQTLQGLELPAFHRLLWGTENLRFLTDRFQYVRRELLSDHRNLRFPLAPETIEEMDAMGFVVAQPDALPDDEPEVAKEIWGKRGLRHFYSRPRTWSRWIATVAKSLKVRSVLEFGCNEGRNLIAIRDLLPDARLVGIDINADAVALGREKHGLDLRLADEAGLGRFDEGEFDLVFTVSVLDHIPEIEEICHSLVRCAGKFVLCLEVTLPTEGKVFRHYDHKTLSVRKSTDASYSWFVDRFFADEPRLWRLDQRPCYLNAASLGPYYATYLAFLDPPKND